METNGDILVLPFFGQGHLFPCVELCKNLSSHNCKSVLIIPSHLSSSIPSTLHRHPLVEVLQIPASYSPPLPPPPPESDNPPNIPGEQGPRPGSGPHHKELGKGIESFLYERYKNVPGRTRPWCVVMDVMMSWSKEIFMREKIPIVSFFTSGASSTALEYAAWKARVDNMKPGETRMLSGLPESMSLSYLDLKRRDHRQHRYGGGNGGNRRGPDGPPGGMNFGPPRPGQPPGGMNFDPPRPGQPQGGMNFGPPKPGQTPRGMNFGPPKPGQTPRWLDEAEGSAAFLINTCHDLEGPFLEYIAGQIGKPVFGVGPLLPESYWKSIGLVLHDRESRPNRESNYTENEVIQWLDSKPSQSIIYVSFGSEVGPTLEEYDQLANALRDSNQAFIWVIQPGSGKPGPPPNFFGGKPDSSAKEEGYYPHGLEEKVGERGLIIKGWAPQLLILSHPSTGGFLSHCGWNSTVEAIGRGVPILAWPIRGDQFYDAIFVVKYLRVGQMVSSGGDFSEMVKKSEIMKGIEGLMQNREVHERAINLRGIFEAGFPYSSVASLKAFIELISK